jgi:hypothetical protein
MLTDSKTYNYRVPFFNVEYCQVMVSESGRSLIQRSPTEWWVYVRLCVLYVCVCVCVCVNVISEPQQ